MAKFMILFIAQALCLLIFGLAVQARVPYSLRMSSPERPISVEKLKSADMHKLVETSPTSGRALELRGGAKKSSVNEKKQSFQPTTMMNKVNEALTQVKPTTRVYLLVTLFCTVVHITGLPAPVLFSLDASKWYEIWRPVTSVAYLGAPSMSMANSMYFLLRYGQTLEETNGPGPHAWFLIVQTLLLTGLGLLLGFPFQGQAMIAAIVYVCSRISPLEKIPIQFGLMVRSWQLPYCMMVIDCLSQQTASAAWPHVLGILTGHIYHFYTQVWPGMGGANWLQPPAWVIERLGGEKASNVEGMDFRKGGSASAVGGTGGLNRGKKFPKLLSKKKGRKL